MSATSVRVLRRNALENDAERQKYNGIALVRQHKIREIRLENKLAEVRRGFWWAITWAIFLTIDLEGLVFVLGFAIFLAWLIRNTLRNSRDRRGTEKRVTTIIDHHWSRR